MHGVKVDPVYTDFSRAIKYGKNPEKTRGKPRENTGFSPLRLMRLSPSFALVNFIGGLQFEEYHDKTALYNNLIK